MATPNTHAIAQGNTFSATDINQFLGTHSVQYINQGTVNETGATTGSTTVATNTGAAAQYIDQPFTTVSGQTKITRVEFLAALQSTGADTTVGIYANSAGVPTGAALISVTLPLDFLTGTAFYLSLPLSATVVASTVYHLVVSGTASTTAYLKFSTGTTVGTQAQTSPTGVGGTWTGLGKSLYFNVFSGTDGVLRHTYEDAGARWTGIDYNFSATGVGTTSTPSTLREWTGALRSVRALSYAGGAINGAT